MDRPTPGSTTPRRRLHRRHDRTAGGDVSGSCTAPSPARFRPPPTRFPSGPLACCLQSLILKRTPIGPNLEDYSVLTDGFVVGRIFLSLGASVIDNGCGEPPQRRHPLRRRTITSRRARRRWRRSPRAGGGKGHDSGEITDAPTKNASERTGALLACAAVLLPVAVVMVLLS
jgi:hypothetical protein